MSVPVTLKTITASVNEDGLALLELHRPQALNALDTLMMEEIRSVLSGWAEDASVRALVLTGSGRAFCAGADLGVGTLHGDDANAESPGTMVARSMLEQFNPTIAALYNFPRPTVIAVNGIAAGGGVGLALCGDLVLASESAALKVVQVPQLGIVADLGANWLLQRAVGRSRAMAMCLLGQTVPAQTLLSWGAVAEVISPEELLPRAYECAGMLAAVPREAVLQTRALVDEAPQCSFEQSLEDERLAQRILCDDPHFMNQVRAFIK